MTANVACAGRDLWSPVHGRLPGTPCGWNAQLDGWATSSISGEGGVTPPVCPECGGRTELIQPQPSP